MSRCGTNFPGVHQPRLFQADKLKEEASSSLSTAHYRTISKQSLRLKWVSHPNDGVSLGTIRHPLTSLARIDPYSSDSCGNALKTQLRFRRWLGEEPIW